jgi:hypothetical protein
MPERCPVIANKEHAMTEERIVRAETPEGNTHTSTTIITDRPDPDSGISIWFVMFAVLLAVLVAIWAFSSMGSDTPVEDPMDQAADELNQAAGAVGEAAGEVRDAASDVGQAASDTVDDAADATVEAVEPAPADTEG